MVFNQIDHEQNSVKIEISLTEKMLLNSFYDNKEYEKEYFLLDKNSFCKKCLRGIFDSDFVFKYPNDFFHIGCININIPDNFNEN